MRQLPEGEGLPTSEEKLREVYTEDQAGLIWRIVQALFEINQGIDARMRNYLAEMYPEKYKELEKKEREEALIRLLVSQEQEGSGEVNE